MHLSDLKSKHVSELLDIALELDVDNASRLRKQELMFAILKKRAKAGEQIFGDGTLEILPDGFGFLRSPVSSYLASRKIFISLRLRSAASIFIPATRLKVKSAFRRTASAILLWSKSTKSTVFLRSS